jgi:hypothetical protein
VRLRLGLLGQRHTMEEAIFVFLLGVGVLLILLLAGVEA